MGLAALVALVALVALLLVALLLVMVLLVLLQAARNAAAITHAVASPRRCQAVMPAECQGPGCDRVTRTG